jgi:hypothetical protein
LITGSPVIGLVYPETGITFTDCFHKLIHCEFYSSAAGYVCRAVFIAVIVRQTFTALVNPLKHSASIGRGCLWRVFYFSLWAFQGAKSHNPENRKSGILR